LEDAGAGQTVYAPGMNTSAVSSPVHRQKRLELVIAAILALSIASIFWSAQRYPALLKKLHQGSTLSVKGALSFDALLKVTPEMPAAERVARTATNWLWTNRFGMYFALPFGAAMMTMLAQTNRPKRFQSTAANIVCGSLAGMPAGVCTNCATPIAQSLLVSGASTRLTIAAMISSPSFNPVVVAMAFVLFPWRLAIARIVVPALLLLLLPLLVKERAAQALGLQMEELPQPAGVRALSFAKTFLRNLLRLTLLTLPWMLLAALLGAIAVEMIPAYGTHLPVSVLGIVALAILGTLLPVPMAFDVALAWVLYRAGVPVPYVATLLCTLGVISVYSLFAMGQQLGRSVPLKLGGAVAALGTAAGLLMMVLPAA
jgi:uncharacterized membrane protein YraQ (UPF0718 family)